jgi:hypothetical protein
MSSLNTRPHTVVVHELCVVKQITRQEKAWYSFLFLFFASIHPSSTAYSKAGENLLYKLDCDLHYILHCAVVGDPV